MQACIRLISELRPWRCESRYTSFSVAPRELGHELVLEVDHSGRVTARIGDESAPLARGHLNWLSRRLEVTSDVDDLRCWLRDVLRRLWSMMLEERISEGPA